LAYREASSVRCAPVMREPLANALATAPPFVLRSSRLATTLSDQCFQTSDRHFKINDHSFLARFR
jgi:hypothetical protein